MNITVVGLGKIGLPLAVQFARKGHIVFGVDVNENTVKKVNSGIEPFPGEANLQEYLHEVVNNRYLTASTDTTSAVAKSDAVVVVVPLYVDQNGVPDFGWMDSATELIGKGLKKGTLVSYETTLPVGTTRNRFAIALEKTSGLKAGFDFHLVFSPERVFTGRVFADLRKYPKLIGGINPTSSKAGITFYESVLEFDDRLDLETPNGVWNLDSCEAAELAKLAETTYRDVNIALANQFALFAENNGIDIHKVINASNSQPFSHIHRPGIAVGGHCIPIYPQMYLWTDPDATVVISARAANSQMPQKVVNKLLELHGSLSDQKVIVLGASYRGGVKETAFSGVFEIVETLKKHKANVFVQDPMFSSDEIIQLGFNPYQIGEPADAIIVQADHKEYKNITFKNFPGLKTILDGRGITNPANWSEVKYHLLGSTSMKTIKNS